MKCKLRELLNEKVISQFELSLKVDLPKSTISEYVNNRREMKLKNARSISKVLKCRIEDLYEWDD